MTSQPGQTTHILGIETSCDETAAAVVARSDDGKGTILSNCVRSQWDEHRAFGGVVPEIAARAHAEVLDRLIKEALTDAEFTLSEIDAIAATAGPGLIGGLLVGLTTAKALALAQNKPLLAINHLEAHALTVGLTDDLQPPYLMLLVTGGHTQLLLVRGVAAYERLGSTIDDALGEAFDKTAKLLGLGFPGGPDVERWAKAGNPDRIPLPRPLLGRREPHFSFAGLKTAVRQQAQARVPLSDQDIADLCAAFQSSVCDVICDRTARAMDLYEVSQQSRHLVVAGGVAANAAIHAALTTLCDDRGYSLTVPPPALCTDNGAMIAWAGAERLARGWIDGMDAIARARWPLDSSAPSVLGHGRTGAKA